jgi:hypothetical protein
MKGASENPARCSEHSFCFDPLNKMDKVFWYSIEITRIGNRQARAADAVRHERQIS